MNKTYITIIILLVVAALASISIIYGRQSYPLLKVGDKAPNISLKDETGTIRNLTDFLGKKVVLYFYPKDNTPGCTKEAASIRNKYDELQKAGIVVLGVSYDSPESHKQFKEKYNFNFILLSDTDKTAAKAYGAYNGILRFLMPKRVTFLIDENGKITNVIENVDVANHGEQILNLLKK